MMTEILIATALGPIRRLETEIDGAELDRLDRALAPGDEIQRRPVAQAEAAPVERQLARPRRLQAPEYEAKGRRPAILRHRAGHPAPFPEDVRDRPAGGMAHRDALVEEKRDADSLSPSAPQCVTAREADVEGPHLIPGRAIDHQI